jgi:hypothetical protein
LLTRIGIGNGDVRTVGRSTIRDIHKILRNCFQQAVKWDLMEKNPALLATVPKHKAEKREIWTAETLMHWQIIGERNYLKPEIVVRMEILLVPEQSGDN